MKKKYNLNKKIKYCRINFKKCQNGFKEHVLEIYTIMFLIKKKKITDRKKAREKALDKI